MKISTRSTCIQPKLIGLYTCNYRVVLRINTLCRTFICIYVLQHIYIAMNDDNAQLL